MEKEFSLNLILLIITILTTTLSVLLYIKDVIKSREFSKKTESWVHSLRGFHSSLGLIKDSEKAEVIRHNIYSTLSDMESYLRRFRSYKKQEITQEKHRKELINLSKT